MKRKKRLCMLVTGTLLLAAVAGWGICTYIRKQNLKPFLQLEAEQSALSADSCAARLQALQGRWLTDESRALSWKIESQCLYEKRRLAEADSLCKLAIRYYDFFTWDSLRIADLYILKGHIKRAQHNWLGATDAFLEAKAYGRCMDEKPEFSFWVNYELSRMFCENKLPEQEQASLHEALAAARRLPGEECLCEALYRLGRHYFDQGDYARALAFHDSLLHHIPREETFHRMRTLETMAHTYLHLRKPEEAFRMLDSAARCHPAVTSRWHALRGEAFEQEGRTDSAATCFRRATHADRPGRGDIMGHEGLFRLACQAGHYREAVGLARTLMDTKDSLQAQRKRQFVSQLQMLHDYRRWRKKADDTEYKLLLRENNIFRILIGMLVTTGILLTAVFINWRRRLKAENKLLLEQREQESLRVGYYKQLNLLTLPLVYSNQREGRMRMSESDWQKIYTNTDTCFQDFTTKLRQDHPSLKEDDIRLCCLLKMDMPLDLIALIFNIEKGSVSQRKQRLRQKMGLDVPLDDYLKRI